MSIAVEPEQDSLRQAAPAERLRAEMAAVRVSFTWLGTRKTLTPQQKARAAETFGAEGQFLSAGKKLLDTGHPRFRAVTAVRSRAVSYWKAVSLPFPEPGIRLIRQGAIDAFNVQLTTLAHELNEAVAGLEEHYESLQAAARERLGTLFNPLDYPASLVEMFGISWDFPSVEPPDYLRRLRPDLYQQECQRMSARFNEAVQLAEQAFIEELAGLVSHLTERLAGDDDGKPKVFRDSVVGNLREFFARFQDLNVRSNEQLDRLVDQCQAIVRGVNPQELRESAPMRQQVATQLSGVQSLLDGLLVDRPRRRLIRRTG